MSDILRPLKGAASGGFLVTAADLSLHLRYLKWHYMLWMRKKYRWKGPIWRERYRSIPIEDEAYLSACGLYVEPQSGPGGPVSGTGGVSLQ